MLLILGSGLGALADAVENPICVPYAEVPHMKRSTAPDHKGQFVFGKLSGQNVAVMQGRLHTYEGWSFQDVSYPVRVLRLLGAEAMIVTNAAGAVNTSFSAGDIMLITDHIKLFGVSPLCWAQPGGIRPRFPDMSHVYTPALRDVAGRPPRRWRSPCGRACTCTSPARSTRRRRRCAWPGRWAPTRWACPPCPEAIVAAHCGMQVLGFTLCTNMAAGVLESPLSSDEVLEAAAQAGPRFGALVKGCLARL